MAGNYNFLTGNTGNNINTDMGVDYTDIGDEYISGFGSLDSLYKQKERKLKEASVKKKKQLDENYIPQDDDEFFILYPNANEQDYLSYKQNKAIQEEKYRLERIKDKPSDLGDVAQDTAISLFAKGSLAAGQLATAVADTASTGLISGINFLAKPLEDAIGEYLPKAGYTIGRSETVQDMYPKFNKTREIMNEWSTPQTQASRKLVQMDAQERKAGKEERIKFLKESLGIGDTTATIFDELGSAQEAIKSHIDNPLAAVDAALESSVHYLGAGAMGKLAMNAITKGMTKAELTAYASTEAGKKALKDAGTAAGLSYTALAEGLSNGAEIKGRILDTSFDKLKEESPAYNELLKQGLTEEQARTQLADKAFMLTAAISGTIGAVSSKITKAGELEGNLFAPNSSLSKFLLNKIVETPLRGSIAESFEEFFQSGGGQLASNIATKEYLNPKQQLSEGVGQASGTGLVAGALSAATTPATVVAGKVGLEATKITAKALLEGAKATPKVAKSVAQGIKEAPTTIKETAKNVSKNIKESNKVVAATKDETLAKKILDTESKNYDPETAINLLTHKTKIPKAEATQEEKDNYLQELAKHRNALFDYAESKMNSTKEEDIKAVTKAVNKLKEYDKQIEILKTKSTLSDKKLKEVVDTITSAKETTDKIKAGISQVFGSMKTRDFDLNPEVTSLLTKLRDSGKLSDTEVSEIDNLLGYKETEKQYESVKPKNYKSTLLSAKERAEGKIPTEVHQDVFKGSADNTFKGTEQYRKDIRESLLENSPKGKARAERQLEKLFNFLQSHKEKAELVNKAYELANKANKPDGTKDRSFFAPYKEARNKVKELYDLNILAGSTKLVDLINLEAKGINLAYNELASAIKNTYPDSKVTTQEVIDNIPTLTTPVDKAKPTTQDTTTVTEPIETKVTKEKLLDSIKKFASELTKAYKENAIQKDLLTSYRKLYKDLKENKVNVKDAYAEFKKITDRAIKAKEVNDIELIPVETTEDILDGTIESTNNKKEKVQRVRPEEESTIINPDSLTVEEFEKEKVNENNYQLKPGMYANSQQQKVMEDILSWWKDKSSGNKGKFFLLEGKGGTGKTTLINAVVKELKVNALFTATTNKAVRVLQQDVEGETMTIHKGSGITQNDFGKKEKLEKYPIQNFKLVIVDEVSMMDDELYNDIIKIGIDNPSTRFIFMGDPTQFNPIRELVYSSSKGKKIPPENSADDSLAFNSEFSYGKLTMKMRQDSKSPIAALSNIFIKVLDEYRNRFLNGKLNNNSKYLSDKPLLVQDRVTNFNVEENKGIIFTNAGIDKVLTEFEKDYINDPENTRILTYNAEYNYNNSLSVGSLTNVIRKRLQPNDLDNFIVDDLVMSYEENFEELPDEEGDLKDFSTGINKNSEYKIIKVKDVITRKIPVEELFGMFLSANQIDEFSQKTSRSHDDWLKITKLLDETFKDITFDFQNITLKDLVSKDVITKDVLTPKSYKKLLDTLKAAVEKTKDPSDPAYLNVYTGKIWNKDSYKTKAALSMTYFERKFNRYVPKIMFAYAINAHKSQGSTYNNVYVLEDNITQNTFGNGAIANRDVIRRLHNKSGYHAMYVAVSRPKKKLVIVGNQNSEDGFNIKDGTGVIDTTVSNKGKSANTIENKLITGDIWDQDGIKIVSTNLGGIHGRGLAKQAADKGKINKSNIDFDSSPKNSDVITLAVKGKAEHTRKIPGQAFSEQVIDGNIDLLKSELRKLIKFAKNNPNTKIFLPYIGLGFGEGEIDTILPILTKTVLATKNIFLISKDEDTYQKYKESFKPGTRKDSSNFNKTTETKSKTPEFDKLPSYKEGQKNFTYAGIGSRETPSEVLDIMALIARTLNSAGYTLQTGNAIGADKAFRDNATNTTVFTPADATDRTREIAKEIHPMGQSLDKKRGLDLHARNTNQVFGSNLDTPVDFVVFYAEESNNPNRPKGGTGQAVELARRKGIPTFNLADPNVLTELGKFLDINFEQKIEERNIAEESEVRLQEISYSQYGAVEYINENGNKDKIEEPNASIVLADLQSRIDEINQALRCASK